MAHKRRAHEKTEVELSRVITPMLDMSFQILFFFVLVYQPSALEGQMEMALPAAGEGVAPKDKTPDASSTEEIDLPAELEVIVRTKDVQSKDQVEDGSIGEIAVKDTAGEVTLRDIAELRGYLTRMRPKLTNGNDIKLQAGGRLKYAYVIAVMDVCREVGFTNVGFAPPPDLQRIIPGLQ